MSLPKDPIEPVPKEKVTCPEGQTNRYWRTGKDRHDHPVIRVYFLQKSVMPVLLSPNARKVQRGEA